MLQGLCVCCASGAADLGGLYVYVYADLGRSGTWRSWRVHAMRSGRPCAAGALGSVLQRLQQCALVGSAGAGCAHLPGPAAPAHSPPHAVTLSPSTSVSRTPSDAFTPLLHLLADIAYRPPKLDRPALRPPPSDAGELEGQILPLESALAPVGQEMDPEEDVDEQYRVSLLAVFCASGAYAGFCCHSMRTQQASKAYAVLVCVARGLFGQAVILLWVSRRSTVVLRHVLGFRPSDASLASTPTATCSSAAWV